MDTMLAAYQRPEISSIFQVRRSTRYEHSPGSPVDNAALVSMTQMALSRMANNTMTNVRVSSLDDLTTPPWEPATKLPCLSTPLTAIQQATTQSGSQP